MEPHTCHVALSLHNTICKLPNMEKTPFLFTYAAMHYIMLTITVEQPPQAEPQEPLAV